MAIFRFILIMALLFSSCSERRNKKTITAKEELENDMVVKTDSTFPIDAEEEVLEEETIYECFGKVFRRYYFENYEKGPDWLGGIYDVDKNHFTIYIVGDLEAGRDSLKRLLGRSDFEVKQALYSYKHLRILHKELNSFRSQEENKTLCMEIGFHGSRLSEKDNRIYARLICCDKLHINKFKEYVSDDACILFREYDPNAPIIAE